MKYSREALLEVLPSGIAKRISFDTNSSFGIDFIYLDITDKVKKVFGTIVEKARQVSAEIYLDYDSDDLDKAISRVLQSVDDLAGDNIALEDGEVEIRFLNGKVVVIGTSEWGSISKGDDF